LAGRDVADHLRKREGIARALLAFRGHAAIIAQSERNRIAFSRATIFKLTHYPKTSPGALSLLEREQGDAHRHDRDFREQNPELRTLSVAAWFSPTPEREPRHDTSPEHTGEA